MSGESRQTGRVMALSDRAILVALEAAGAPARWLARMANAVSGLDGPVAAAGLWVALARPLPLGDLDLLALLRGAALAQPLEGSSAAHDAPGQDRVRRRTFGPGPNRGSQVAVPAPGGTMGRPQTSARTHSPEPTARSASTLSPPDVASRRLSTQQLRALSAAGNVVGTDPRTRQARVPPPLPASASQEQLSTRAILSGAGSPPVSPGFHRPRPASEPPGMETAGAALLDWLTRSLEGPGQTLAQRRRPEGERRSSAGSPGTPTQASNPTASERRSPGLGPATRTDQPELPASESGSAPGRRMVGAQPPSPIARRPGETEPARDVVRLAIARAFRAPVTLETLPLPDLAALAVSSVRDEPGAALAGKRIAQAGPSANAAEMARLISAPDQRFEDRRSIPADTARSGVPPARPEGLALLDAFLAQPRPAPESLPPVPPWSTPGRRLVDAEMAGPTEGMPSSSTQAGALVPPERVARDEEPGIATTAVQNTFNVTVHMAGDLDDREEELAERLNRILVEQARRYGIDI